MRKINFLVSVLAAVLSGTAWADCYRMDNAKGTDNLGVGWVVNSTDRFLLYQGTVNLNEGSYFKVGGNDNDSCNFIGIDRSTGSTLNINGGTFWAAKSNGAGVLAVGNKDNNVTSTLNLNSGELIVDTRLRLACVWSGTGGAKSSGTVNINSGTAKVTEFHLGATSSGTGTATLNLNGGTIYTSKITFPSYSGQVFNFGNALLIAQAANIFSLADYKQSGKTRTLTIKNTASFDTAGYAQTIPAFTGTGWLHVKGGGALTFAQKELTYNLVLNGVTVNLGTLDAATPSLKAPAIDLRTPLTLNVTLPANPSGRYPLFAGCDYSAAGVIESATVNGGGAGKLIFDNGTVYLDFDGNSSEGIVYADAAGGAVTPAINTATELVFGNGAGSYTIVGDTAVTLSKGLSNGSTARQTITAPLALSDNLPVYVGPGGVLELAGTLTGNNPRKYGAGTLVLSGGINPNTITLKEGVLDLAGRTITSNIGIWGDSRPNRLETVITNGTWKPSGDTSLSICDAVLRVAAGAKLDLTGYSNSRIALGYGGYNNSSQESRLVIDGGTMWVPGNASSRCNFILPDTSGTAIFEVKAGEFRTKSSGGNNCLRIATGGNRQSTGIVRVSGGLLSVLWDLTMASQYDSNKAGSGRAYFEQTGGRSEIAYFYLGHNNSGIGEATVTLTGGTLAVKMLKCTQYSKQTLVCDGATIEAQQNDSDSVPFMTQLGSGDTYPRSYTVGANGLTIDTAAHNVRCAIPFVGVGALTVKGAGVLNLTAAAHFNGGLSLGNGTRVNVTTMRDLGAAVTLAENAVLALAANNNDPVSVKGAATLAAGAKLRFEMGTSNAATFTAPGGFVLPEGETDVLDFVEVSDADKYEAVTPDANTIVVRLKDLTTPVEAVWTGAGDVTNIGDPANWSCLNAAGEVLANAIPTAETTVRVTGTTTLSIPEGQSLARRQIVFGDCAHRAVQLGRGPNHGTDMNDKSWLTWPLTSYVPHGNTTVDNLIGQNTAWQKSYLATSTLRFDGWFEVPAAKAGTWTLTSYFDDSSALFVDGAQVFCNPTYRAASTATWVATEGWHRFTFLAADTGGGYGSSLDVGGQNVPLAFTVNGTQYAFTTANLNFGNESNRITLGADCDWRGLGVISMNEALVIDLNGHNLKLDGVKVDDNMIGAQFTNSVAATTSTLTIEVPAGQTVANTGIVTLGNIQVVKSGAGTFSALQRGNTSAGLTIAAGTLAMPNSYDYNFLAGTGSDVTVDAGATLELNGAHDLYNRLILNGGFVRNQQSIANAWQTALFKEIKVTADSTMTLVTHGLIGPNYVQTLLDLQGHTLTMNLSGNWSYFKNTKVTDGTLKLYGAVEIAQNYFAATNTTIEMYAKFNPACPSMDFGEYIDHNPGTGPYSGEYSGTLRVFKRFQPNTDYFYGCELQDGAILDLTTREGVWSPASKFTPTTKTNVTFAAGATIVVDIQGRKFGDSKQVMAWTNTCEPPADVKFVADPVSRRMGKALTRRSDGLYLEVGFMVFIR